MLKKFFCLTSFIFAVSSCTDESQTLPESAKAVTLESFTCSPLPPVRNILAFPDKGFGVLIVSESFAFASDISVEAGSPLGAVLEKNASIPLEVPAWTDVADWRIFTEIITPGIGVDEVSALVGAPVSLKNVFDTSSMKAFQEYGFTLPGGSWLCLSAVDGVIFEKLLSRSPMTLKR